MGRGLRVFDERGFKAYDKENKGVWI